VAEGEGGGEVPLAAQREHFSLPPELHYLNCAYMSPLPRIAEEAGVRGIRRKRVPSEIGARDFFRESDEVRRLFARLVGADEAERVAILPSASYGIAVAARNLPIDGGENVVVVHEQFPGNVYGWLRAAGEAGAEVRRVRPPEEGARGRGWNRRILEAIDERTAVVSLGHVHWTDGTRFDLEAIGRRAREVGAAFVVDGTQSVGALPFDVERIRPDALICAAYKWLLGPYSLGLGYFGPRFDEGTPLEETWIAREGSEDFSGLVDYVDRYQPGAIRYDVGERSNFVLLPMLIASLRLLLDWGVEEIQAYTRRLGEPLIRAVREEGFTVEEEEWRAAHLFGIRMPEGIDPRELAEALERARVAVSVRGSAVRVSPHLYNDAGDVEALRKVLVDAVAAS